MDITWAASKMTKFFKHESCGKCTPCREGTYWLDKVLDRIMAGEGQPSDVDLINNIAANMQGATLCALGDFAANPILATIRHFPDDFKQHMQKEVEKADADDKKPTKRAPSRGRAASKAGAAGD